MHAQMHAVRHNSHAEDQKCKNISIQVYVDDCFGLITADKNKNEDKKIALFLDKMENYYLSNQLVINIDKTVAMIISDKKETKAKEIMTNGGLLSNSEKVKILGTIRNYFQCKSNLD